MEGSKMAKTARDIISEDCTCVGELVKAISEAA